MSFELNGKLKVKFDPQSFPSGFTKREFVVTMEDGQYPQDIKFELVKDKTTLVDRYNVGDQVKVSFNIRGNEYNGKYFVNLVAWRIENIGAEQGAPIPPPLDPLTATPPPMAAPAPAMLEDASEDDLPF